MYTGMVTVVTVIMYMVTARVSFRVRGFAKDQTRFDNSSSTGLTGWLGLMLEFMFGFRFGSGMRSGSAFRLRLGIVPQATVCSSKATIVHGGGLRFLNPGTNSTHA